MAFASGQIFVYDSAVAQLSAYQDFFASRSLNMFGTDNIYQLTQYSREISPEIMVFNLNDNPQAVTSAISHLSEEQHIYYPIIVLNPHNVAFVPPAQVAHYLKAPINVKKFTDIIESYCIGYKQHQILLLDSVQAEQSRLSRQMEEQNYNYFEVHNGEAANRYLSKNSPQLVCIEYSVPFILERHNLEHDRIIYVDRHQDIAEIERFLH